MTALLHSLLEKYQYSINIETKFLLPAAEETNKQNKAKEKYRIIIKNTNPTKRKQKIKCIISKTNKTNYFNKLRLTVFACT